MKHSEFWTLMERHLGSGYARMWAERHVMSSLDGKTVLEALEAGMSPQVVWRAVHAERELPPSVR